MGQRLTPEFFYGSAISALCGLLLGLMLHVAWQNNPGGPQIQLPESVAAATAVSPAAEPVEAGLDAGHTRPSPLPVTRLAPQMFDVQPAAADGTQRDDAGDLVVDAAPPAPPTWTTRP
jgi:hypothetical protein